MDMSEEELDLQTLEGIGPATKQKLIDAGIRNILDLAIRGPAEVAEAVSVDASRATEFCNRARKKLVEMGRLEEEFVPASEIYERRMRIQRITTGSKNLDDLLSGGLETQAMTEVYGEFGSGKTQLCHTMCVTVQLPRDQGGLDGSAIYIDTENTFRPERVYAIAASRGLEPDRILQSISVAKAYNSAHQELIVGELGRVIEEKGAKFVVLDSVVAHYRAEYLGRGTLAERQQRLNRLMHLLLRTAEVYDVAILVTNQVLSAPDVFFGDPSKPTGGHVVAHTSTYRLYLRKAGKNRIARMVDSPYHPEREAVFVLNEMGVDDPEEMPKKR